jgi:large subunit ribosomal protein L6
MIGKKLIKFPLDDVAFAIQPSAKPPAPHLTQQVSVNGPLGSLSLCLPSFVQLKVTQDKDIGKQIVSVAVQSVKERKQKAMWGTARALIQNMIEGVTEGYTVPIRFEGVGYRVSLFVFLKKKFKS